LQTYTSQGFQSQIGGICSKKRLFVNKERLKFRVLTRVSGRRRLQTQAPRGFEKNRF
jgi:hypothetical protein